MSGEDNFIARWSRLKQQAAEEKKKPSSGIEAEDRRTPDADSKHPAEPVDTEPAFDPASLPPIESIVAGSDIRAFLQKGVPAALTKAALRRAWTTDPAIRDFIEVAENQWDFTDPTAIPGFGPLPASDNLRQLVGQALGNLPDVPDAPDAAGVSQDNPDAIAGAKAAADGPLSETPTEASAKHMQAMALPEGADNPDTVGVAALQHPQPALETGNAPRRKGHGSAMPR